MVRLPFNAGNSKDSEPPPTELRLLGIAVQGGEVVVGLLAPPSGLIRDRSWVESWQVGIADANGVIRTKLGKATAFSDGSGLERWDVELSDDVHSTIPIDQVASAIVGFVVHRSSERGAANIHVVSDSRRVRRVLANLDWSPVDPVEFGIGVARAIRTVYRDAIEEKWPTYDEIRNPRVAQLRTYHDQNLERFAGAILLGIMAGDPEAASTGNYNADLAAEIFLLADGSGEAFGVQLARRRLSEIRPNAVLRCTRITPPLDDEGDSGSASIEFGVPLLDAVTWAAARQLN